MPLPAIWRTSASQASPDTPCIEGFTVLDLQAAQNHMQRRALRRYPVHKGLAVAAFIGCVALACLFKPPTTYPWIAAAAVWGFSLSWFVDGEIKVRSRIRWQNYGVGECRVADRKALRSLVVAVQVLIPDARLTIYRMTVPVPVRHQGRDLLAIQMNGKHYCIAAWYTQSGRKVTL